MKFEWLQIVASASEKAQLRAQGWVGYTRSGRFIAVRPAGVCEGRRGWEYRSTWQELDELGVDLGDDVLVPIRPSDVKVSSPLDLGDMFGKAEAEQFAVLMIWTLAANGNEWRSVTLGEVGEHVRSLVDPALVDEPPSWAFNPFLLPSPHHLLMLRYAESTGPGDGPSRPITLTAMAISELTARFGNA